MRAKAPVAREKAQEQPAQAIESKPANTVNGQYTGEVQALDDDGFKSEVQHLQTS